MKIYFAGSIRGGRADADLYRSIIKELQSYGDVLTEHIGKASITARGELGKSEEYIYNRDIEWLEQADIVVAEVTQPSLGVGYELAYAEKLNIRVVCLHRIESDKGLSAMIKGDKYFEIFEYKDLKDVEGILKKVFMNNI